MKFLLLLLPLLAHADGTCLIDGHEGNIANTFAALVKKEILGLKAKKGIEANPDSIKINFEVWGTTSDDGQQGWAIVKNDGATFTSRAGTPFRVKFYQFQVDDGNVDRVAYQTKLEAQGFDHEGNPIKPQCFLVPDDIFELQILNNNSQVEIDNFKLPVKILAY